MLLQLAGLFVTAFVVGLSGALMPGPLLAITVDEGARRGAHAGPLIVLGHMILEALLVAGIAAGLAVVLTNPWVTGLIGLIGGAATGWMGQNMLRSAPRATLSLQANARRRMHPVTAGILVSLANPYWSLWWATIGLGYLVIGLRLGLPGVAAFFAGHILADLTWYTLVSWGVARGRRLISGRAYRVLVAGCGAVLVAFGLWFITSGVVTLARRRAAGPIPAPPPHAVGATRATG